MKFFFAPLFFLFSFSTFSAWETLDHEGSLVHLYKPAGYSQARNYPLMVSLHGCAQKAEIIKDHGNWEEAADQFNVIVAIPRVPNGGVIAGCWDYYNTNHTRTNRHNGFVISLAQRLVGELNVQRDKVFVSGLSSGAGLSMVLGCMAPDVFSGIGLNAGPSLGTSSGEISRATIKEDQVKQNCVTLAGNNLNSLKKMKVSIIYGNNDFLVDPNYNRMNARVFSSLLDTDQETTFNPNEYPGENSKGSGILYLRGNEEIVSIIENTGLGHNWPAGQGGSSRSFVNKNSLNYPYYILEFFTK